MPQNRKSFQVCINLNCAEVLLPVSSVEPEKVCEIVKIFTNKVILPKELQDRTQRGRYELECMDRSSILALHNYQSQGYFLTLIPYSFLETPI